MPEVASKIESTSTDLAENPRSQFLIRNNDYIDLLAQMTTELSTQLSTQFTPQTLARGLGCAAELMNYFQHWNKWKRLHYQEEWFYQPLRKIHEDLRGIYSFKIIRGAIAFLKEASFLSVRQNDRATDGRNGGDRTHRYLIDKDRVAAALAKFKATLSAQSKKPKKAETLGTSPLFLRESPSSTCKTPNFTVETHTKIQSINPSKKYSLLEEQEELKSIQKEIEDLWTVEENDLEQEVLTPLVNVEEILQEQKDSGEDQFSAAPEPKCSEMVQPDLKPLPKLKRDCVSGFRSQEECDAFYKALLELGKTKGVRSPAAWSTKIVKSIDAGEPCHYLSEYREGQQVGSCEQQEWEIAPGQVFPRFISYLTTTLKKAGITDEQAIVTAHQQLKDVNLARSLWESCKRAIANYQDNWEKQKQLGVSNAYLPPELLPKPEVNVEQLGSAIASLQDGSVQLQGLPESARAELEPAKEEPSVPVPEPPSPVELQEKLNSSLQAPLARMMARNAGYRIEEDLVLPAEGMPCLEHLRSLLNTKNRAPTAKKIQRLIEGNPQEGFYFDEFGELWGF